MPTDFLHGIHFANTELYCDNNWITHELPRASFCKPCCFPSHRGLTLQRDGFLFHGTRVDDVKYSPSNHAISFGGKDADGPVGAIFLAADNGSYTGHWQQTPQAAPQLVRGFNTVTYYSTKLQDDDGVIQDGPELTIGTVWEDTDMGGHVAVLVVKLDDEDVSNRCAVVATGDNWTTTYAMKTSDNPVVPDNRSFNIVVTPHADEQPASATFVGVYTDNSSQEFKWTGESIQDPNSMLILLSSNGQSAANNSETVTIRSREPAPLTTTNDSADLSVTDLVNVTTLVPSGTDDNGEQTFTDTAQQRTGEYFQNMLIGSLPGTNHRSGKPWVSALMGQAPTLSSDVSVIQDQHTKWLQTQAVPNMGQLLHDNVTDRDQDVIAKIDTDKIQKAFDDMGQSADYDSLSQKLYVQAYHDAVPGIQRYIADTDGDWGDKYFNYITGEIYLNLWASQVASQQYKNVKQTMYENWVKLAILCPPDSTQPTEALSTMLSTILHSQYNQAVWTADMEPYLDQAIDSMLDGTMVFQDEILENNKIDQQNVLNEMLSTVNQDRNRLSSVFLKSIIAYGRYKKPVGAMNEAEYDIVVEEANSAFWDGIKSLGSKGFACFKIVFFGAVTGYLLAEVIGEKGKNVLDDTGLALIGTGFLVKDVEYLLSTSLGKWMMTESPNVSESSIPSMLRGFGKWFTEEGVDEGSWAAKVLGTSSAEFLATRLGPALTVFSIVMCSIDLSKAIKSGSVADIVFDTLNLAISIAALTPLSMAMMSIAWAGAVGLAIAAIGLVVAFVQLIWSITHPPKPPPDPISDFVNGPLKDAGYTK